MLSPIFCLIFSVNHFDYYYVMWMEENIFNFKILGAFEICFDPLLHSFMSPETRKKGYEKRLLQVQKIKIIKLSFKSHFYLTWYTPPPLFGLVMLNVPIIFSAKSKQWLRNYLLNSLNVLESKLYIESRSVTQYLDGERFNDYLSDWE